ncbi:MAG: membrane protein insertion efficiency factor YidD [Syntrophobacterales bacterium]|nr:membrane protein insertion efficiency factor YidD [Syntrophobacterales bacterium]
MSKKNIFSVTFGKLLVILVRIYQIAISPLIGSNCRFYPTCSEYTITALQHYGPFKGMFMGIRRILRCNPWNPGGYDPVK